MKLLQEKGFSLVELSVVMAIFAIAMMATIPVIRNAIKQQKTFEAKAEIKSYQRILEKVVQKAIIAVRPEHYKKEHTYVFNTDLVNNNNPMGLDGKILPPFEESLVIDFRRASNEPGSFVEGAISGSVPRQLYNMQLNSFTLGVMKVEVSGTKKLEGALSRLLLARCVRNGDSMQGEGSTIDASAPIKSTMRVVSINRFPFLQTVNGKLEVRCCRINQSKCSRSYPDFIPKIYSVTLDKGVPQSIHEYPGTGNKESMGTGFVITFNQRKSANYFRIIYYDMENTCQLTLSGASSCKQANPALHLADAGTLKLNRRTLKQNIMTRSFVRFGRVKKGFESSGVIVLGE